MNRNNLKLLAKVLGALPARRTHDQKMWVGFLAPSNPFQGAAGTPTSSKGMRQREEDVSCHTSACAAGHGALSDIPELEKREGEGWEEYIERVYGCLNTIQFNFAFGSRWDVDTAAQARARIEHLVEHGKAPPLKEWSEWGEWGG